VGSLQLATWGVATLIPAGLILLPFGAAPVWPDGRDLALLAGMATAGIGAYLCLMQATRGADVSFVAPFRYARIVFALLIGFAVFGERPDLATLTGAVLIVGSGLYTFARERRLSSARRTG
jgi:drug/metabolite transporter (DMT)-like permease